MDNLISLLSKVPDPRVQGRCEHRLSDILAIALCCIIAKGETFEDMEEYGIQNKVFLETFLSLPAGIPSHDTFRRVFGILESKSLSSFLANYSGLLLCSLVEKQICLDGKKLRGATPTKQGESGIYLLNAWVAENQLCVYQERVEDKSNEITAIPKVLAALDITDALVSIDAMGCQKDIAKEIKEKGGHYLFALKENQGTLYQDTLYAFKTATPIASTTHLEEKGETRICTILDAKMCLPTAQLKAWEGLSRLVRVESSRTIKGETTWLTRYYINDETEDSPAYFNAAVRGHWGVENQLHWFLDVIFKEDDSRIRKHNAPQNVSAVRKVALQMLRNEKTKISLPKKRYRATMNQEFLKSVLTF
jgi:predicted transposase YbfD/YdcC